MKKFQEAHRIIAIVALSIAIVAYFLQLIYFVTFFSLVDAPVNSVQDQQYHTTLFIFLVLEMMICIGIVGYSAFSIYRAIYDDDSVKEGPDVMFLDLFIGFIYLFNGLQNLSWYIIFKQPVDGFVITTLVLSLMAIILYIPLICISNSKVKNIVILRYLLRFLIMGGVGVCVVLNLIYIAGYDAFAITVSAIELLVPISIGVLLVAEA